MTVTRTAAPRPAAGGRPRDPDIDRAILDAALAVLAETGYARLSIGEVAQRAGVHKPAVYRRYANKLDLAIAAVEHLTPSVGDPATGDLRGDLVRVLRDASARAAGSARIDLSLRLRADIAADPALAAAVDERIVEPRRAIVRAVLGRAVAAGQARADADPALVFDLLFGALSVRTLRQAPALGRREANQIADVLARGLAPG